MRSCLLVLFLLLFTAFQAGAQRTDTSLEHSIALISEKAGEVEAVANTLQATPDTTQLQSLKERVLATQVAVTGAILAIEPQLGEIDARLAQLGEASDGEGHDIRENRNKLQNQRVELDSAIKRGRLVEASAGDLLATINRAIAEAFNRDVFERVGSPLSPYFWSDIWHTMPVDVWQAKASVQRVVTNTHQHLTMSSVVLIVASFALSTFLLGPARRHLDKMGLKLAMNHAPGTRLRRSGLALWFTVGGAFASFVSVTVVAAVLRWTGILAAAEVGSLTSRVIGTISFASFVMFLGNAMLLVRRPSWRLPPISDGAAYALRWLPSMIASILASGVIFLDIIRIGGLSSGAVALASLAISACYAALFMFVLHAWKKLERHATGNGLRLQAGPWMLVCRFAIHVVIVVTVFAALSGYINFSLFIGRSIVWAAIVATAAYLVLLFVDDFTIALCSSEGGLARSLQSSFGLRAKLVEQAGIVVSAALRLLIAFGALFVVFAPFGPGTSDLFTGIGDLSSFTVAGITFEVGALLRSALVMLVSLVAVRLVLSWLDGTYLPATELDAGARNSVLTMVKYIGFILAGLWTVNTLGIGMERIALVVSALSVGIGFGLQAITQNFISGLILLAERPVKIGDTVRLGTDEGDVKKISVRSTEIQISDRSTLIVPNSELITKTIRNMTPGDPIGRVQIPFAVSIANDPHQVRQLILDIYEEHPGIVAEPKPGVLIESIADGKINFDSYAFVSSSRLAASTKSDLLFTLIERFRAANIPLHTT
ncbi:DUF3772 domain-containing protein [Agrobacterium sp. NPDC089420]|uniref:DUF3772 domain-containing protein n=1 Tax=Agrobacterium sp. NPDC089420 TaxID=3363918 RepID=UPI00384CE2FE